jgi:hypothetical protein
MEVVTGKRDIFSSNVFNTLILKFFVGSRASALYPEISDLAFDMALSEGGIPRNAQQIDLTVGNFCTYRRAGLNRAQQQINYNVIVLNPNDQKLQPAPPPPPPPQSYRP